MRLEYHGVTDKGNPSEKYWEIRNENSDGTINVQWGKIGTEGRTTVYESMAKAMEKASEKEAKGYVIVYTKNSQAPKKVKKRTAKKPTKKFPSIWDELAKM